MIRHWSGPGGLPDHIVLRYSGRAPSCERGSKPAKVLAQDDRSHNSVRLPGIDYLDKKSGKSFGPRTDVPQKRLHLRELNVYDCRATN